VKRSVGRDYFLFIVRAEAAFGAAARFVREVFPALRVGAAFRRAGSASRRGFAAVRAGAAVRAEGRDAGGAETLRTSAAGARWTSVNRVWSPMVW